jgi:hypothetical protein
MIERECVEQVPRKLKYCTPHFLSFLCKCYETIMFLLPKMCMLKQSVLHLIRYLNNKIPFVVQQNCEHTEILKTNTVRSFTIVCAHNWATGINRYLCGKDTRPTNDPILLEVELLFKMTQEGARGW